MSKLSYFISLILFFALAFPLGVPKENAIFLLAPSSISKKDPFVQMLKRIIRLNNKLNRMEVVPHLRQGLVEKQWILYGGTLIRAIEAGIITEMSQLDPFFEKATFKRAVAFVVLNSAIQAGLISDKRVPYSYLPDVEEGRGHFFASLYLDVVLQAIESGLIETVEDLKFYTDKLKNVNEEDRSEFEIQVQIAAYKKGVLSAKPDVNAYLEEIAKPIQMPSGVSSIVHWNTYSQIVFHAIEAGIFSELSDVEPHLERMKENDPLDFIEPVLYPHCLIQAIRSNLFSSFAQISPYLAVFEERYLEEEPTPEIPHGRLYSILLATKEANIISETKFSSEVKIRLQALESPQEWTESHDFDFNAIWRTPLISINEKAEPILALAIRDGVFKTKEELIPFLVAGEYRRIDYRILEEAVEAELFTHENDVAPYLEEASPPSQYAIRYKAYQKGVVKDKPDLETYFQKCLDNGHPVLPVLLIRNAIQAGEIKRMSELRPYLPRLDRQEEVLYIFKTSIEEEIDLQKSDIETYLGEKIILAAVSEKVMEDYIRVLKMGFHAGVSIFPLEDLLQLFKISQAESLPLNYVAAVEYFKRDLKLEETQSAHLYQVGREVLKAVQAANASAERKDQKIDLQEFEENLLQALVHLSLISENLTKQILDQYLHQRGYLPILRDVFSTFSFLNPDAVKVLRDFYLQTGTQFVDNPDFLMMCAGYVTTYPNLGLSLETFRQDLMGSGDSIALISVQMGKRVILSLAKKVGIDINRALIEARAHTFFKDWDFRYFGLVLLAQSAWYDEQRELFNLLLKAALEGTTKSLLYPPEYNQLGVDVYGERNRERALRVRRHNLNFLKEMETLRLKVSAWLQPNKVVPPHRTVGRMQRKGVDILNSFRIKLTLFKTWLEANPERRGWDRIERAIGPWARIKSKNPSAKLLRNREQLGRLKRFVSKLIASFPAGKVPQEVADIRIILEEITQFDSSLSLEEQSFRIRFWHREVGKDIFLGNYAGSCTALGDNASAIFEFLLDQGTQYVVLEDLNEEVVGYARFFLAFGTDNKPKLYIESIDGTTALENEDPLRDHIVQLALAIGLTEQDVIGPLSEEEIREKIKGKVGGTLTEYYFVNSSWVPLEESDPDDGVDGWMPQEGWPEREELPQPQMEVLPTTRRLSVSL